MNARHALLALGVLCACAGETQSAKEFHTSGSREADQRAEQRMSKTDQMRGEGDAGKARAEVRPSLFERLGGESGIGAIVDDFVDRAIADPRANWPRRGITSGGVLGVGARSSEWGDTPDNRARIKKHFVQFFAVASGGPPTYEGRDMKQAHAGMKITNAELDAVVGDLKASLDALRVPHDEQKELLALLESARPQVVEVR